MFSIIVPSYNRKNEIPTLLASLSQQSRYNFEVIIVDDFSREPVEIEQTYPFQVKVIRNERNLGAAQSRNVGAENAKAEWLLFLDDDDRFLTNKCELLEKEIIQSPEVNFIYHPAECIMVNEGFHYFTAPYENIKDISLDNILKANKIGGMPMIAIRKSFFMQVNGLSADLHSLEDYEFILKVVSEANFSPKYVGLPLTQCTFHTQRSSVSTNMENTEKAIAFIKQKYIKTENQRNHFEFNSLYMLAYPYIMRLSRRAAKYYFEMFKKSKNIKFLAISAIIMISPKLAIHLKRFI